MCMCSFGWSPTLVLFSARHGRTPYPACCPRIWPHIRFLMQTAGRLCHSTEHQWIGHQHPGKTPMLPVFSVLPPWSCWTSATRGALGEVHPTPGWRWKRSTSLRLCCRRMFCKRRSCCSARCIVRVVWPWERFRRGGGSKMKKTGISLAVENLGGLDRCSPYPGAASSSLPVSVCPAMCPAMYASGTGDVRGCAAGCRAGLLACRLPENPSGQTGCPALPVSILVLCCSVVGLVLV